MGVATKRFHTFVYHALPSFLANEADGRVSGRRDGKLRFSLFGSNVDFGVDGDRGGVSNDEFRYRLFGHASGSSTAEGKASSPVPPSLPLASYWH